MHTKRCCKKLQKWRTGCEGRISVLKRRHGLQRSRYKGLCGMKRWVGLGVIADNLIHIGDPHGRKQESLAAILSGPQLLFPNLAQALSSASLSLPPLRVAPHAKAERAFPLAGNFAPESS